jgi:CheY-like chemotaxis protein
MTDTPRPRPPHAREPEPLASWPAVPEPATHHRRVLVVEDNPDAAQTLAMLLHLLGHEVRVAHTGPDGVREAVEWSPDVVICDIGLPGLDGYGVARELRSRPSTRGALLIALTAYGMEEDVRRAGEAGFNYHVTKPADPNALVELLWSEPG